MNVEDRLSADDRRPIAFSSLHLDRRAGQLTRGGQPIPVRRKTWEVLLYLVERPGVLVTKEELLDAVWPEISVTPDVLIRSIRELRLALGDDSRKPRCIETVHRRGYRFIAEVRVSGPWSLVPGSRREEPRTKDQQPRTKEQGPRTSNQEPRSRDQGPATKNQGAGTTIIVGRDHEMRRLEELLAKARAGERQIVFVAGPVGIGKSALVEAFLDSPAVCAAPTPVWIGRGSCVEQHVAREPYMPVLDALERLARRPHRQRLTRLLRRVAPTWLAQIPWLLGDKTKAARQSRRAAGPERMLREFAAVVEALTTDVTVVLVLEDLHWSDAATVDLLAVLAQRREPARLLVIGTYRPADATVHHHVLSQGVRALQMHRQCVDLPLHEITEESVRRYLEVRFPGADFPARLAPMLHDYTDGTPLFVVAVVEHMLSRGWILETAPGWALSTPLEKLQLEVPDDARRMIEMQFDSLSPTDRALLQAASVVGPEFTAQSIAAGLKCGIDDAEARCEALARVHSFLRVVGSSGVARRYAFTHELHRHAAYAEIPDGHRHRLEQRIGEALEAANGKRVTAVAPELAVQVRVDTRSRVSSAPLRWATRGG